MATDERTPEEVAGEPLAEVTEILPPAELEQEEGAKERQGDERIQPLVDMFEANRLAADAWANALEITCQADVDIATDQVAKIKKSSKIINSTRLWFVEDLKKYTSKVDGLFNPIKNGLDAIEKKAKRKIQDWLDEQERIRQEEQRKLDAEAEKKRKLHATLATKAAQEAAEKQENGQEEDSAALMAKAQEQLEKAHAVGTDVAAPKAESSAGSHSSGRWVGEITDKKKFIKGLASGVIPWDPDLIQIPQGLLNDKARSLKTTVQWPGVRFYQERSLSVKAAE